LAAHKRSLSAESTICVAVASLESLGSLKYREFLCQLHSQSVACSYTVDARYLQLECSCDAGTWSRNHDDTIGAWYVLLDSFIVSPSVAALAHRRPASAGTSGDCCAAEPP
jgi:hypothetical protein